MSHITHHSHMSHYLLYINGGHCLYNTTALDQLPLSSQVVHSTQQVSWSSSSSTYIGIASTIPFVVLGRATCILGGGLGIIARRKSKKNQTMPENFSLPLFVSLQAHGVPFWVVKITWHRTAMVSIQCYSIPPSFKSLPHLPPHCTTHSVLCIVYFIEFDFIG